MDQSMQNRTKKFLQLLKNNAQNEAFVQLVTDNLKLEIQQRPWKLLRILDFITNDLPRSNSDFTRLKINESGLLRCVIGDSGKPLEQLANVSNEQKVLQGLLDRINSITDDQKRSKYIQRLNESILTLKFDNEIEIEEISNLKLNYIQLSDILKNNREFFKDLISNYQPLLSDLTFNQSDIKKEGKDEIKQMVMESIGGFKTDKIKLSDLIDESFFDDIEDQNNCQSAKKDKNADKNPVSILIENLKRNSYQSIIDLRSLMTKRLKTDNVKNPSHRFILMSPQLALALEFIQNLVNQDWKIRQSAASILKNILKSCISSKIELSYYIAQITNQEEGYQIVTQVKIQPESLGLMILPLLLIFLMKDQFNDFEELKVLTPAREEGIELLLMLLQIKGDKIQNEISILIQQLPVILKAVEVDTWPSRYNFFLLLKGLTKTNSVQIFQMFNRVLIESLLKVEEEVMILVTELIQSMLDQYIQQPGYEKQLSQLILNLQQNLKQSDEIESSSISVFQLINYIMDTVPYLRYLTFDDDEVMIIFQLTLQSIVMEKSPMLVKALFMNLQGLLSYFSVLTWLYTYHLQSFETFMFFESKNFESINRDYYQIVFRPTTSNEIQEFYEEYLDNAINQMIVINDEAIGIYQFTELDRLQQSLQILFNLTQKNQLEQPLVMIQQLNLLLNQCYQDLRLVNIHGIQQHLEFMTQVFGTIQIPEIYECFSELMMLFTSLIRYASQISSRVKSLSAIIHIQLVELNELPTGLTSQLNNLIKPILSQSKSETIEFIQEICSIYMVKLINLLFQKNKSKPAQQILLVLTKSLEQYKDDEIQDRGTKFVICQLIKTVDNIFTAYNGYMSNYLVQQLTVENSDKWVKFTFFLLQELKSSKKNLLNYCQQSMIISEQITTISGVWSNTIPQQQNNQSLITFEKFMPNLIKIAFEIFPEIQIRLISNLVARMEQKQKIAFQALIDLIETKNNDLMKFIPVFIIPVIQNIQYSGRIFNDDKQITLILASLLSLLPLNLVQISELSQSMNQNNQGDQIIQQKDPFLEQLQNQASEGYRFLQTFVNNQMVTQYQIDIKVKAQLRDYQKQGINWMATLGRYNLNCALCDDMGLGKTLQSLTVVMNESQKLKKLGKKPVNLIVCPTTITHNWFAEVQKFFDGVKAVVFEGSPQVKQKIIQQIQTYDIVIISYEKLRNEIKQFQEKDFFYLILDEAHIIKNSKAKITIAVKSIKADKKLALTGTPLQNRVSELWSIFDFLMPGFLEQEQVFNKKYNQYLTSNIKKLSENLEETQAFLDALKSLKKRIQPFILRRTKDQVLKELPPKIIQDVICQMTNFQEYTHSLIEKNHPITQQLQQVESQKGKPSQQLGKQILQNLILHRKVCNHPMFVAKEFSQDKNIMKHLGKKTEQELLSYENSGKLIGLYDKLVECEIIQEKKTETQTREESKSSHQGVDFESGTNGSMLFDLASTSLSLEEKRIQDQNNRHRVLIFCQMTSYLKVIVDSILKRFNVSYLELLSSHTPKQRVEMCNQFNQDPSISVLILTTQVGGLGLNLTGADTVIFAEHDWNPMKDLQAIDRAHRIGQTKQVCVYRLIVKDTIEEKIMGLQRFKENLAKSLVQAKGAMKEEASNLEMSELLNSFQEHSAFQDGSSGQKGKSKGQPIEIVEDKLISNLDEIWKGENFENF
ncbi:snf2 chromatin remodeling protein [Stylonychia lemnae]|uniref:Snf2 chromatin remodeling protein n=1 Tax=Stylonychia lemnae TaxID=5949 RepID=A0A078A6Y0_STYLE|nr:snf2 chromatin remodeling protein [Stylonychia lemnae]|eukprot:CDW76484.1 snf2 chromatin remodeling protein [Stylonychia lemnae]